MEDLTTAPTEVLETRRQRHRAAVAAISAELRKRKLAENDAREKFVLEIPTGDVSLVELRRAGRAAPAGLLRVAKVDDPRQVFDLLLTGFAEAGLYGWAGDESAITGEFGRCEDWHFILRDPAKHAKSCRVIGYTEAP